MSKRRRIRAEKKIQIAKACMNGTISLNAAAEQLGVHKSVVDDWVRLYQTEGILQILRTMQASWLTSVVRQPQNNSSRLCTRAGCRRIIIVWETAKRRGMEHLPGL